MKTRTLVVLGPTASGKTSLGVRLARELNGEILSADSRQVYRGLDLGAGKDLEEYTKGEDRVPLHLIDLVDLDVEYSVFDYQRAFFRVWEEVCKRGRIPIVVGGTGLYLEAVLKGYRMVEAPRDAKLRRELESLSQKDLAQRLRHLKPVLHNATDLEDRDRTVRAIEIAEYTSRHPPQPTPQIDPLLMGVRWNRSKLRERIASRLKARLRKGLIEEVEGLREQGYGWERLERLGLEYRYVSRFLKGEIENSNDLFQKLNSAIAGFAKRQETWFRRMERNGFEIHWIDRADPDRALDFLRE